MVTIIFPSDPSTIFLQPIIDILRNKNIPINLLQVEANKDSYSSTIEKLKSDFIGQFLLFLGHGSENSLFGGESIDFDKQPLISLKDMVLFKDKIIFLLACDSNQLLKKTFRVAQIEKSLGFGPLPTELAETNKNKFKHLRVTTETIEKFKAKIVSVVAETLSQNISRSNYNLDDIRDNLVDNLNFEINQAILKDNDRILADLLYFMKDEIEVY
jgi:hypothetical protein